jgi:hypothetical protein
MTLTEKIRDIGRSSAYLGKDLVQHFVAYPLLATVIPGRHQKDVLEAVAGEHPNSTSRLYGYRFLGGIYEVAGGEVLGITGAVAGNEFMIIGGVAAIVDVGWRIIGDGLIRNSQPSASKVIEWPYETGRAIYNGIKHVANRNGAAPA